MATLVVVGPALRAAIYRCIYSDIQASPYLDVIILNAVIPHIFVVAPNFDGMSCYTTRKKSLTIVHYVISVSFVRIITKSTYAKYIKCPYNAENSCLASSVEHREKQFTLLDLVKELLPEV